MLKVKDQGHKRKCSAKKNFFFRRSKKKSQKSGLEKNFLSIYKILTIQKIVLFLSRGQCNIRELEVKDIKMCPRGQGHPRGLHLCCNISQVFRTSKKVVIDSFCCFLFLNYGKKVKTVASNAINIQSNLEIYWKQVAYF